MSDALLRLSGVACMRGGRLLLRGIDLTLAPGQSALLRGPNGMGKSSLIRLAAGLLPAFGGTVERYGKVALSDESLALDRDRTLAGALGFWARMDGVPAAAVADALSALGLSALADIPVRMLSTGQRKRAMLARVAASGAPIWLLDEPANGLDSASVAMLGALIGRHLAGGGVILAASHQDLPLPGALEIDLSAHLPQEAQA
ncbi:heme ABC exporter ATP-binding protein CcmA [Sphingobium phenoxybenzoativorans]|uniref:Heme ABC exporter ATP-binding protein CcmA n=1 Tax=Sphingobium phenoxybenzoativorans TaxID=1592790 RepID=A0A975K5K4_9SPHN|nr:heme ABC exporter ATP-binding protein CcmA [Sphingobium phenoxybenzoativorans]QUT05213.1 heme ABC exporter ATP-binding protein CcmA [Sphingobium phenoxybenzoativorans]